MIKRIIKVSGIFFLSVWIQSCASTKSINNDVTDSGTTIHPVQNLEFASKQIRYLIEQDPDSMLFPSSVRKNGQIRWVKAGDWTSGFFPGELWMMYQYTHKKYWKVRAEKFTRQLSSQQYNTHTHDVGFMINSSYGNGYNLIHSAQYKKVVIQAAKSLATRFNSTVGAIKSWNNPRWKFPVIIDNMMNLQLLFHATQLSGDSTFYHIAYRHALTTMRTHIRPNGSSFHLVNFNPKTGKVIWKGTVQGYANNSTWARGEAWALYGFTSAYHYTHDKRFLKVAEKVSHYILTNSNLPEDDVPYWDYNAPNIPNAPRDASAAAIMSSAFLQLSTYVNGPKHNQYLNAAKKILHSLSSNAFRAKNVGNNHGFILKRCVGNKPGHSEVTVPLIYADYYYIEANLKYLALENKNQ